MCARTESSVWCVCVCVSAGAAICVCYQVDNNGVFLTKLSTTFDCQETFDWKDTIEKLRVVVLFESVIHNFSSDCRGFLSQGGLCFLFNLVSRFSE